MSMKRVGMLCVLFSGLLSGAAYAGSEFSGPAQAIKATWVEGQNLNSPFMRVYGMSLPPIGFVNFCETNPADCRKHGPDQEERFDLTDERWQELQHINISINKEIQPVTDKDLYGQVEKWTYPLNKKGDCEDYVLLKRLKLLEHGWPESALLITVVLDEQGEGHAIMTIRTAQGDFILDNKRKEILLWSQTPYRFIKRQSYRDPKVWVSLMPGHNWTSVPAASAEQ